MSAPVRDDKVPVVLRHAHPEWLRGLELSDKLSGLVANLDVGYPRDSQILLQLLFLCLVRIRWEELLERRIDMALNRLQLGSARRILLLGIENENP